MDEAQIAAAFPGMRPDETGLYFTKDDIQGEYDVEAKVGSTLPLNRENKVKIIETAIEIGPALGIVAGSPASIALGKALFRELDMKEVSDAYDQQAQMMEQMQKMSAAAMGGPQMGGTPMGGPQAPVDMNTSMIPGPIPAQPGLPQ